jgi:hypothetical protein
MPQLLAYEFHVSAFKDHEAGSGVVGSSRGAVCVFCRVRFLGLPAEPDVRVRTHPALDEIVPLCYLVDGVALVGHGVGMVVPR